MPVISLVPGVETPDVLSGAGTKVRVPELVMPPPLNEKSIVAALANDAIATAMIKAHQTAFKLIST